MEELVEQWSLGGLSLRNRIFMAPVKTAFGTPDGRVTERHLHFYRAVAEGGAAMVILEPVAVTAEGREHPKQLSINHEYSVEELSKITALLHEHGAQACLNLNHAGRAANPKVTGLAPVAPSACSCQAKGTEARELSAEEITTIVKAFGEAARKAGEAGFDAIEIQAGHGYLIQQFMIEETNSRSDAYGKDRLLFANEVLAAARGASKLPVLLRVTRPLPFSQPADETLKRLIKLAEEDGAVAIHAGMGDACAAPPWYYHHGSLPEKPQQEALAFFRDNSRLPLIGAGRMGDHERVRRLFASGLVDAVALGRPLVADPALPAKWLNLAYEDVVQCGSCLQGCLHNVANGKGISCIVNPTVGKPPITPAANKKRALVAGAGPAGLSCALTLWKRGHGVIVAEASNEMGGTFRAAPLSFGKEAMQKPLRGLLRLVEREEIPIIRNQPVDEAFLKKIHPDLLIWAAGSAQNVPPIPGLDKVPTLTSLEFYLEGKRLDGKRVLVIGGGMVGVEAAETLAAEGHQVTIAEMLPGLANNMEMVNRNMTLKRIAGNGAITSILNATITSFGQWGVNLKIGEREQRLPPFDWVLVAAGLKPKPLPEQFRKIVKDIRVVGDANTVRDVESATREGYETGLSV